MKYLIKPTAISHGDCQCQGSNVKCNSYNCISFKCTANCALFYACVAGKPGAGPSRVPIK